MSVSGDTCGIRRNHRPRQKPAEKITEYQDHKKLDHKRKRKEQGKEGRKGEEEVSHQKKRKEKSQTRTRRLRDSEKSQSLEEKRTSHLCGFQEGRQKARELKCFIFLCSYPQMLISTKF